MNHQSCPLCGEPIVAMIAVPDATGAAYYQAPGWTICVVVDGDADRLYVHRIAEAQAAALAAEEGTSG